MRILRAILPVFALFAVCATGGAWAMDGESVRPVQVAQAQNGAPSGDDRPATVGDLRHFESRMDERMTGLENRMDDRMRHLESRMMRMEDRMIQMFTALLAVMIALYGLPQLPSWWGRLRAGGKNAVASGIFLIALVVITAGAAIAAV